MSNISAMNRLKKEAADMRPRRRDEKFHGAILNDLKVPASSPDSLYLVSTSCDAKP
ncbi:MAG: hypothetical protein OEZ58_19085 [Gammaproteobacteria bacterium]|nr:hypothetical protein [Gammaproteobacteria bacterium]